MSSRGEEIGKRMKWSQPKATVREYLLTLDGREVAKLTYVGIFGSLARGQCAGKTFTFKRGGFLRPFISIRKEGFDEDVGTLRFNWGFSLTGELILANGIKLLFFGPRLGKAECRFTAEDGRHVCSLSHVPGLLKRRGDFVLESHSGNDPDPLLLALLLWYAAVLISDEEASSVTVVAATAINMPFP